jgi:hypothetical protein
VHQVYDLYPLFKRERSLLVEPRSNALHDTADQRGPGDDYTVGADDIDHYDQQQPLNDVGIRDVGIAAVQVLDDPDVGALRLQDFSSVPQQQPQSQLPPLPALQLKSVEPHL